MNSQFSHPVSAFMMMTDVTSAAKPPDSDIELVQSLLLLVLDSLIVSRLELQDTLFPVKKESYFNGMIK